MRHPTGSIASQRIHPEVAAVAIRLKIILNYKSYTSASVELADAELSGESRGCLSGAPEEDATLTEDLIEITRRNKLHRKLAYHCRRAGTLAHSRQIRPLLSQIIKPSFDVQHLFVVFD